MQLIICNLVIVTNSELFHIWNIEQDNDINVVLSKLVKFLENNTNKIYKVDQIRSFLQGFIATCQQKWKLSSRNRKRFSGRESDWLKLSFNYLKFEDMVSEIKVF